MDTEPIRHTVRIDAPAPEVGHAITSAHGLGTWLCDEAHVEKRHHGRILCLWNDGRRFCGRWVEYAPGDRLAWSWRADDEAAESTVRYVLEADGAGTRIEMTHAGVSPADAEAIGSAWSDALEDLKTYVETGRNGREMRRPMLGINPQPVTPELAREKGLAVEQGILLAEVMPDRGALRAGLARDDVLVAVGDVPVSDWGSLMSAVGRHRAGDTVRVTYWRGDTERAATVTLTGRESPAVGIEVDEVADAAKRMTARWITAVTAALDGVSEAEASFRPAPHEWSIKQVLAHLSVSERFGHDASCRRAADEAPIDWAMEAFELREEVVQSLPLADLAARLVADLRESEAIALAILARRPFAPVRYDLAAGLQFGTEHIDDHIEQIRANVAAARGTPA
jgi:uncharacterized protein YndB with AHSA1/START domain